MAYLSTAILVGNDGDKPASGDALKAGRLYFATDTAKVYRDSGSAWVEVLAASASGAVATDPIWDAAGDLAVGTGSNTAGKLAIGTALQMFRTNAGATSPEWFTPPSCRVKRSADLAIVTSTPTMVAFTDESYKTVAGMHDNYTNNSRVIAPIAGKYLVVAQLSWENTATGYRNAYFGFNGSGVNIASCNHVAETGANVEYGLSAIYSFAANEYVELGVWQSRGSNTNLKCYSDYAPSLEMHWLGS